MAADLLREIILDLELRDEVPNTPLLFDAKCGDVDNTMRAYPEIAANWEEAGIVPDKRVAFYCGTGWRASETWFYAYLMGWPRIAVYDGGWYEWSRDPLNNPIEVGEVRDELAA